VWIFRATRDPSRSSRPNNAPMLTLKAKQPTASGHVSSTCSQIASGSAVPKIERSTFGPGHSDAAMIGGAAAIDTISLAQLCPGASNLEQTIATAEPR
jgi:hypothetical protein